MNSFSLEGRARVFGDNINTDYIITSRRKRESLDPQVLRQYLFEEINPGFAASVVAGDLIVAGKNFGCGSAMEVAVTAVLGAGIRAVLARSFSRTYYRNAINNGLLPVMCDTSGIEEGDRLVITQEIEQETQPGAPPPHHVQHRPVPGAPAAVLHGPSRISVQNLRTGAMIPAEPLPQIMLDILNAGGLVEYFKQHHDFVSRQ